MSSPESVELPAALAGERRETDVAAGCLSYYVSQPEAASTEPPLLLLHTINAAASAHEIRPLFDHYRQSRAVYAPDFPGYGFSERRNRRYLPRDMTDAVHAMLREIEARHGPGPVDAVAVSLSCEFLARAATESPSSFRSLALVSPTGFNRLGPFEGPPESNRGIDWLHRLFSVGWVGQPIFRLLTSRRSVRYFLQRTWGGKDIDEEMFEFSWKTAQQPNARFAPFSFLSGFLFSNDISRVYRTLEPPVWMTHGVRGDFTDYRLKRDVEHRDNWQIDIMQTGALPYFEEPDRFAGLYDTFRGSVVA